MWPGLLLAVSLGASPEFVVVPRKAELYLAPAASAQHLHDRALDRPLRPGGEPPLEEDFWVFAVGGRPRGEFLPVDFVPGLQSDPEEKSDPGYHCYANPAGLDGLRLHFFVRTRDLAPVVVRKTALHFSDGSALTLLPGVVVKGSGRKTTVMLDGLRLAVPVPANALGTQYRPVQEPFAPPSVNAPMIPGDRWLYLDGARVDLDRAFLSLQPRAPVKAGDRLAEVDYGCASYRFRLKPQLEPDDSGVRGGLGLGFGTLRPEVVARAGAAITWRDGSPAGEVEDDTGLHGPEQEGTAGRRCFGVDFRLEPWDGPPRLWVCFAPEDLRTPADGGR